MMSSYSYNETFTITNAKYLSSKVASDLKRIQRYYGKPSDQQISDFEKEITILLKGGFLSTVTFGFKKNGLFIKPTLHYTASDLSALGDDDPGRVPINEDVTGAVFSSFLVKNEKFALVSDTEKEKIENEIPVKRVTAANPSFSGVLTSDKNYLSNGVSLNRSTLK